ncbi:MAG: hypothetical protein RLZZ618_3858 [Pseudomonadota bacterium]|jgi:uncharacterized surface protein with fasciclin (FAS1) repeats
MNQRFRLATALSAAALMLSACASAPAPKNLADTIATTPQLSTLNRLVVSAGLTSTLQGPGPLTVFAPSDDAFKALPAKTLESLSTDKVALAKLLSFHVVPATVLSADAKNGNVKTVQGANVAVFKAGPFLTVEDAVVTTADTVATNGVVQIIDRVLTLPK